jgi:flavin-binding protein dodecin
VVGGDAWWPLQKGNTFSSFKKTPRDDSVSQSVEHPMPDAIHAEPASVMRADVSSRLFGVRCIGAGARNLAEAVGVTLPWEATMSVARVTEIISASDQSFEHAVREGIERANQTLENIKEAWVASQRVVVENGKIIEYRVTLKVTFVLR